MSCDQSSMCKPQQVSPLWVVTQGPGLSLLFDWWDPACQNRSQSAIVNTKLPKRFPLTISLLQALTEVSARGQTKFLNELLPSKPFSFSFRIAMTYF